MGSEMCIRDRNGVSSVLFKEIAPSRHDALWEVGVYGIDSKDSITPFIRGRNLTGGTTDDVIHGV